MFRKLVLFLLCACAFAPAADKPKYLFVWAGDDAKKSEDFLAVIDAGPQSKTYGQSVATVVARAAADEWRAAGG